MTTATIPPTLKIAELEQRVADLEQHIAVLYRLIGHLDKIGHEPAKDTPPS